MTTDLPVASLDSETTGLDPHHGCRAFMWTGCTAGDRRVHVWQSPVDPNTRMVSLPRKAKREIRDYVWSHRIVFHNLLFDVGMLHHGDIVDGYDFLRNGQYEDTMVGAYCVSSSGEKGLKPLTVRAGIEDDDEEEMQKAVVAARLKGRDLGWRIAKKGDPMFPGHKGSVTGFDYWLPREVARHLEYEESHPWWTVTQKYAEWDAVRTLVLHMANQSILQERSELEQYWFQMDQLKHAFDMHEYGMVVKKSRSVRVRKAFLQQAELAKEQLVLAVGPDFNPDSQPQLASHLYQDMGLPALEYTGKGKPSTKKEALLKLMEHADGGDRNFIETALVYRACTKAANDIESYIERGEPVKGHPGFVRLHPKFNPVGTPVNRYACKDPNAQAVRKRDWEIEAMAELGVHIRECFAPVKGREMWAIDYDQLHFYLFSYLSGDKTMISILESGGDFHSMMGSEIFGREEISTDERRIAKAVNYGFIYGAQPRKIEATSGMTGLFDILEKRFPSAIQLLNSMKDQARKEGHIFTADGQRLKVPKRDAYKAINYYIQGTEGYLVKQAIVDVDGYLIEVRGVDLSAQVHDELVFDSYYGGHRDHLVPVCELMEGAGRFIGVPCKVEAKVSTTTWAGGKVVYPPTTGV